MDVKKGEWRNWKKKCKERVIVWIEKIRNEGLRWIEDKKLVRCRVKKGIRGKKMFKDLRKNWRVEMLKIKKIKRKIRIVERIILLNKVREEIEEIGRIRIWMNVKLGKRVIKRNERYLWNIYGYRLGW